MEDRSRLKTSVISSSSRLPLRKFLNEVVAINGTTCFDISILRDTDVLIMNKDEQYQLQPLQKMFPDPGHAPDITCLLAIDDNRKKIVKWLIDQCTIDTLSGGPLITALATYFPDITNMHSQSNEKVVTRRSEAISALANTILIAIDLKIEGLMEHAIVEAVCGTVLDVCKCANCRNFVAASEGRKTTSGDESRVFLYDRADKIDILCQSLLEVVSKVKAIRKDVPFSIALELEPGHTYILNSPTAIQLLFERLSNDKYSVLPRHIGLNLDLAHMKIANITATQLRPYCSRLVHAHIADNPGQHTRDQVVGLWTPVECESGEYYGFLDLLMDRMAASNSDSAPLFSGTIALELEGCNRISWIHQSLAAIKHLTNAVAYRERIPCTTE